MTLNSKWAWMVAAGVATVLSAVPALADHSWGNYHWARKANPFTLSLGDNVNGTWDPYLRQASTDWNASFYLQTNVVAGRSNPRNCRPTSGRIEVCNAAYGSNGWLGIAQIWASGGHITQGVAKLNDTYFNTATYNSPAWRRLVMCQEVAHAFGLDHQDEAFNNPNLGSCMDYTNDPDGPPSNEHPNAHDFQQLETIYLHTDSSTTVAASTSAAAQDGGNSPAEWGRAVAFTADGRGRVYVREAGRGQRIITFVLWVRQPPGRGH